MHEGNHASHKTTPTMKNSTKFEFIKRVQSRPERGSQLLQGIDATETKGKKLNMTVDLLRNVDINEIKHVVVLDKELLQGISEGKNMFDSAMDLAGSFGLTSGRNRMNQFLPASGGSRSQQMMESMFDVSFDNGLEDRARRGQSGANSNVVEDVVDTYNTLDNAMDTARETFETAQRAFDGDTDAMIDLLVDVVQFFTPWYLDPVVEAAGGAAKGEDNWLTEIADWFSDTTGVYHENPDDITGGGDSNDLLLSGDHLLKRKILQGVNPRINPSEEDQNNNYGIVFVDDPTTYLSGSNLGRSTGSFHEHGGAIIATGKFIDGIFSSHGGTSTGGNEMI